MSSCAWHGASQWAGCCRVPQHSGVCSTGSLQRACWESVTHTNTAAGEQSVQECGRTCTVCTPAGLFQPAHAHSQCTDGLQAVSHLVSGGKWSNKEWMYIQVSAAMSKRTDGKWTILIKRFASFLSIHQFTRTFIHWWPSLPCKVPPTHQ